MSVRELLVVMIDEPVKVSSARMPVVVSSTTDVIVTLREVAGSSVQSSHK